MDFILKANDILDINFGFDNLTRHTIFNFLKERLLNIKLFQNLNKLLKIFDSSQHYFHVLIKLFISFYIMVLFFILLSFLQAILI